MSTFDRGEFDRRRFRYHAGPSTFTTPPSYNPGPHEWVLESQATPAPPPAEPKDKWVPYVDPLSDQVYWINEKLNQQYRHQPAKKEKAWS